MGPDISNPVLDAPDDVLDVDLPCAVCGYNLRSTRRDAVCTECGTAVARSLGRDNALWEARPAWLRSLSCGVWMMIAAQVLFAASFVATPFLPSRLLGWLNRHFGVVLAGLIVLCVLLAAGAWLLTRRERLFVRPPAGDTVVRLAARVGMLGPLGAALALAGNYLLRTPPQTAFLVFAGMLALAVPGVLATYWHLRGLARRVLSRRMSEYATIVAIGGAVTVLALIAWFVAALNDVRLDVNSDGIFLTILLVCVAAMLFYGWSLVVLAMFAVSFARASRAARALWNEHAAA